MKSIAYEIIILDRAQEEIDKAYEYYAEISLTALKSFDEQLEQLYQRLEPILFFYSRYKNLRALPFKSFPFMAFFRIDDEEKSIYIYSVFNTSQNPEKYPKD